MKRRSVIKSMGALSLGVVAPSLAKGEVLAAKQGSTPAEVPVDAIQQLLIEHGAIVPQQIALKP